MTENSWNNLDVLPPDEMLEVVDEQGIKGFAQPTYYPFEIIKKDGDEKKPFGFRGTPVFYEDGQSKWDGGWLIQMEMNGTKIGSIKQWRKTA